MFSRPEKLGPEDAWYCSTCKKHQVRGGDGAQSNTLQLRTSLCRRPNLIFCVLIYFHFQEATKTLSLWRLPEYLVVHLKRFSWKNVLWREKLGFEVSFPLEGLDLGQYLPQEVARDGFLYDLFGVVNHFGAIWMGHYTALTRHSGISKHNLRIFQVSTLSCASRCVLTQHLSFYVFHSPFQRMASGGALTTMACPALTRAVL